MLLASWDAATLEHCIFCDSPDQLFPCSPSNINSTRHWSSPLSFKHNRGVVLRSSDNRFFRGAPTHSPSELKQMLGPFWQLKLPNKYFLQHLLYQYFIGRLTCHWGKQCRFDISLGGFIQPIPVEGTRCDRRQQGLQALLHVSSRAMHLDSLV